MLNLAIILFVYGIFIEEIRISFYRDKLEREKINVKSNKELYKMDKETIILKEELKASYREFKKNCEEMK